MFCLLHMSGITPLVSSFATRSVKGVLGMNWIFDFGHEVWNCDVAAIVGVHTLGDVVYLWQTEHLKIVDCALKVNQVDLLWLLSVEVMEQRLRVEARLAFESSLEVSQTLICLLFIELVFKFSLHQRNKLTAVDLRFSLTTQIEFVFEKHPQNFDFLVLKICL